MNVNINIGLGTLIAILLLGVVLGGFFAGKLEINVPEEAWQDAKVLLGVAVSLAALGFTFHRLYFVMHKSFSESWALSYLIFVLVITLFMYIGYVPNPALETRLVNRFTGKPLSLSVSTGLWASAALKLMWVGVREL